MQVECDCQLGLQLENRSPGVAQKLAKFPSREPALALSNMGRNGYCGPAKLADESVLLRGRESVGNGIYLYRKRSRLLPRNQLSI